MLGREEQRIASIEFEPNVRQTANGRLRNGRKIKSDRKQMQRSGAENQKVIREKLVLIKALG